MGKHPSPTSTTASQPRTVGENVERSGLRSFSDRKIACNQSLAAFHFKNVFGQSSSPTARWFSIKPLKQAAYTRWTPRYLTRFCFIFGSGTRYQPPFCFKNDRVRGTSSDFVSKRHLVPRTSAIFVSKTTLVPRRRCVFVSKMGVVPRRRVIFETI
jgi:hypothetical protein